MLKALTVALAALVAYTALVVTGVAGDMRELVLRVAEPRETHLTGDLMQQTITYTKTLPDGTVVTATYVQQTGESYAAFVARAKAAWAEVCKQNGD